MKYIDIDIFKSGEVVYVTEPCYPIRRGVVEFASSEGHVTVRIPEANINRHMDFVRRGFVYSSTAGKWRTATLHKANPKIVKRFNAQDADKRI